MAKNPVAGDLAAAPAVSGSLAASGPIAWRAGGFSRFVRKRWLDVLMVTPLFAYILFFMLVPVGQSIYLSFVHQGTHSLTLANYDDIIHRSQFKDAVINTIGITVIGVSMEMVAGIIIALMLARGFQGRGIFRSIVLVPLGVPTIVAGAAMLYFVGYTGYLNEILLDLHIISQPIYWQQSGIRGMFTI